MTRHRFAFLSTRFIFESGDKRDPQRHSRAGRGPSDYRADPKERSGFDLVMNTLNRNLTVFEA